MEIVIIAVVIIALVVWKFKPSNGVPSISTEQLKGILQDQDKLFIDVRTRTEFKAKNIRQFKNIPLGNDFSKLPKNKEIIVICQSGMRSKQACAQLKKLGYEKVTNVRGGMSSY